jgi:hypothetical protein
MSDEEVPRGILRGTQAHRLQNVQSSSAPWGAALVEPKGRGGTTPAGPLRAAQKLKKMLKVTSRTMREWKKKPGLEKEGKTTGKTAATPPPEQVRCLLLGFGVRRERGEK